MFCENCGKEISDNSRFCEYCGYNVNEEPMQMTNQSISNEYQNEQVNQPIPEMYQSKEFEPSYQQNSGDGKRKKVPGIIDIVAAGILLLAGLADADYDWGLISLSAGAGILIAGILQIMNKSDKAIGTVRIVFGGITFLLGCLCSPEYDYENIGLYDWGYIGLIVGISLLVIGILGLTCKTLSTLSIVSIVAGGILILCGLKYIDYDWGITGAVAGTTFLVSGILNLINSKKNNC